MSEGPFYGKYRGRVVGNFDPNGLGRIEVEVPDVTGLHRSTWAMPCLPIAGNNRGLFSIPPIDAGVWVEYEGGNMEKPIWVGGFWGSRAEIPSLAPTGTPGVDAITLQTTNKNGLVISDAPDGGILIQSSSGAKISVNGQGIVIDNGNGAVISMSGSKVDVNHDALTVE